MTTAIQRPILTAVEIAERFGPIPIDRLVMRPAPGTATEEDAIQQNDRFKRRCELVDGLLVEKVLGSYESVLAAEIARLIGNFVKPRKLGVILGEAGLLRLAPGLIRIPEVSFLSADKFPGGKFPRGGAWPLGPDLAIEVLSPGNTHKEMTEKLHDYFASGAQLVWYVDPLKRQVEVFTSPEKSRILGENEVLDGGAVLPGFELSLKELFADLLPE
jgi:Uma2 family endonuclease